MNQELLKSNLNGLERKILVLVNEHKSLKDQVRSLREENEGLKEGLKARDQHLADFKNQIKFSKIVDRISPEDGGISELKKKVEEYILEIDRCISHLSR